jgi:hypothetical protein
VPPQTVKAGIVGRAVLEHFLIKREKLGADPSFFGGYAPIRPACAAACRHENSFAADGNGFDREL